MAREVIAVTRRPGGPATTHYSAAAAYRFFVRVATGSFYPGRRAYQTWDALGRVVFDSGLVAADVAAAGHSYIHSSDARESALGQLQAALLARTAVPHRDEWQALLDAADVGNTVVAVELRLAAAVQRGDRQAARALADWLVQNW